MMHHVLVQPDLCGPFKAFQILDHQPHGIRCRIVQTFNAVRLRSIGIAQGLRQGLGIFHDLHAGGIGGHIIHFVSQATHSLHARGTSPLEFWRQELAGGPEQYLPRPVIDAQTFPEYVHHITPIGPVYNVSFLESGSRL